MAGEFEMRLSSCVIGCIVSSVHLQAVCLHVILNRISSLRLILKIED